MPRHLRQFENLTEPETWDLHFTTRRGKSMRAGSMLAEGDPQSQVNRLVRDTRPDGTPQGCTGVAILDETGRELAWASLR